MKKIFMIVLCNICIVASLLGMAASIAFAEGKFIRFEGRALRYAVPLYGGTPPSQYTYKSLGRIEYVEKWNFQSGGYVMCAAQEGLANKAKAMGANAVIKVEPNPKGVAKGFGGFGDFSYAGEAVIFDKLPEKPYK